MIELVLDTHRYTGNLSAGPRKMCSSAPLTKRRGTFGGSGVSDLKRAERAVGAPVSAFAVGRAPVALPLAGIFHTHETLWPSHDAPYSGRPNGPKGLNNLPRVPGAASIAGCPDADTRSGPVVFHRAPWTSGSTGFPWIVRGLAWGRCLVCTECGAAGSVNIVPKWHDTTKHVVPLSQSRHTAAVTSGRRGFRQRSSKSGSQSRPVGTPVLERDPSFLSLGKPDAEIAWLPPLLSALSRMRRTSSPCRRPRLRGLLRVCAF